MNRELFYLLLFHFFSLTCKSQADQWAWMNGTNAINQPGVFGIQGTANSGNRPPALFEPAEWTDKYGNFWLFGGVQNSAFYNTLWKYDPVGNTWTWMNGASSTNQSGKYGTQGVFSSTNTPGSRGAGSCTWTDANGYLWLFGGMGMDAVNTVSAGYLNDLWKYDPNPASPTYNQWMWVKGSTLKVQLGIYGTKGIPTMTNTPGARYKTSCSWIDNNGNLWLLGGVGKDSNPANFGGFLNDLWKYDPISNMWTWMNGDNIVGQNGFYGTMGVANMANKPGGRDVHTSWKDMNGFFWLYGGYGYDDGSGGLGLAAEDDLWKYDPDPSSSTYNQWTWMGGSNTISGQLPSSYGVKCSPASSNNPGPRVEARTRWIDDCGNFWMFGGYSGNDKMNDLWRYDPSTGFWTWVSGDSIPRQPGIYASLGASPLNKPASRNGAVGWRNKEGIWLFGGEDTNGVAKNDFWKYIPDTITPGFSSDVLAGCSPLLISFISSSIFNCNGAKDYTWDFGDPSSGSGNNSTIENPSHTFNGLNNTYTVTYIVTSCTGQKDSLYKTVTTVVAPLLTVSPSDSVICPGGIVTLMADGANNYEWTPLPGISSNTAASITVAPTVTTTYTVTGINGIGCYATASLTITVLPPPNVNAGNDVTIAFASTVILSAEGNGTYSWSPSTGLSCNTCINPIATPVSTTIYILTVTDVLGCSNSDTIIVTVEEPPCSELFVPNAFSPNGNGQNDILYIKGDCFKSFRFAIYNRWGEIVFETTDVANGWNGRFKGYLMDSGIFTFTLSAITEKEESLIKTGTIALLQ